MSGIKKYMVEDAYLNDMEKAYELVDEDDYEYYDDSFDDYDDSFDYPDVENNIEQFYGVDGNGTPKYVALSKEQVQNFARTHPEEDIVRVESSSGMRFNLYEALKAFDKKQFKENASSCELEMLYESVRDTLSAQQKNDLAKFVRKARTAEEINTYMTGMLAKAANESLEESSHFEYGDAMSKANQAKDIIDSAKDKNGREVCVGSSVIVPQQLGYSDREADVEDIFINNHNVEMLRVKYNDSKTENVAAKSCTLVESLKEEKVYSPRDSISKDFDKKIEDILDDNGIIETVEYGAINDVSPKRALKIKNILDNLGYNCKILNDYDICQILIKESLTEDVDEATFNKLKEIAYELDAYIEDKVWVRDFWYDGQFDNTISFEIYGDWKHDHARFRYYASEWLDNKGLKYKMWETITDDDGSDSYGATHTIRLYDIAEESTVEEAYISQSTPQEQPEVEPEKFSNGTLRDFDPYPFIKKIMNSGKSMNSIRTLGDDYYTIFVSYMNHFGPKGIDDKDTRYSLDIIKETPDGEQTRDLYERDLLWNEVAEKLSDWRQDKVTENPLAESIAQLTEGYAYRKVEKAILQAISDIGGECFETIDNDSCSYRFEGKVSRKALITNLADALKSTGYTILSDNSGVEVQDNDNWWQGTNIEIYNDTDNQEKGYSFFIIGIYDLS